MTRAQPVLLMAALLLAAPGLQAAAPDAPDSYAARWPLVLPVGSSLVRLPLGAEVLTQLQTSDLRDIRVYNAAGQAVPMALDRAEASRSGEQLAPIELPTLPIHGAEPAGATGGGQWSVRIDDSTTGRVVRVETPASESAAGARPAASAGQPASVELAGALVDTRLQTARVQAIELTAEWPSARPFTFRLHSSTDLQQWAPLGSVTVYRGADGAVVAPARVALQGESLKDCYLRVTWDGPAAPGAVQIKSVRLLPLAGVTPPARLAVPLALPDNAQPDAKALEWRLPFATPLSALGIRAEGGAAVVPVRVLGRQQSELPWTPLGRLVVFNLPQGGQAQFNPPLELGNAAWREWRLEADTATPGFTAPPRITAWLAPARLVFAASGAGPFTLAAGRADAPPAYLPLASLIPGHEPGAEARLPLVRMEGAGAGGALAALPTTAPTTQRDLRRWMLWAVLALGVAMLAGMAWVLMRQLNKTPDTAES